MEISVSFETLEIWPYVSRRICSYYNKTIPRFWYWLFECKSNTYGNNLIIAHTKNSLLKLTLCEIVIYGKANNFQEKFVDESIIIGKHFYLNNFNGEKSLIYYENLLGMNVYEYEILIMDSWKKVEFSRVDIYFTKIIHQNDRISLYIGNGDFNTFDKNIVICEEHIKETDGIIIDRSILKYYCRRNSFIGRYFIIKNINGIVVEKILFHGKKCKYL